jgi:hypothetical protein
VHDQIQDCQQGHIAYPITCGWIGVPFFDGGLSLVIEAKPAGIQ